MQTECTCFSIKYRPYKIAYNIFVWAYFYISTAPLIQVFHKGRLDVKIQTRCLRNSIFLSVLLKM